MARHRDFNSEEVIDKSIDVFLSQGFEATAIKDIVGATNVHPGSLYNAFGNKKEIFMQALERFVEVSQFNLTLASAETAPPRAAIEKLFHDLIESTDQRGAAGKCLISKAAMELGGVDEDITAWLSVVFEKSENLLCRLIERGQAAGEISSPRPARELAQFLTNTVQGMQLTSRFDGDKEKFQAIAKMALAALDQTD
jgi:TetR/AcrR family transcriptional regulator, transcriptional repressor for nem operon